MVKYFCTLFFIACSFHTFSQVTNSDVLFTVEGEPSYASEFIRVFNKNLDLVKDESQKDVDEYLKLFVNYKLKLHEARALKLDEKPTYIRELSNYKKQLAKNFTSNTQVTDALVAEAYERISNEVKASHILIRVEDMNNPQDTLAAYNQLLELRDRILKEGYDTVKNDVHDGKQIIAENLGYFSGFKMVYSFENVAFNTKVGDVSLPFKTRFGYHIVNVQDKRKSRGERTVGHIMISSDQKDATQGSPEDRINDLYKKIQQGEDFESLAKQFSDDKSSAKVGGKLSPFSGGQLSSAEFEDVSFGLKEIGDVSAPFQSGFGWHIVKLYHKKPIESFDVLKSELRAKVKRDKRSQLIDDALVDALKVQYNVSDEQPALAYFTSILNEDYFRRLWSLPENFKADEPLIKIGNKQFTYLDFGNFLKTGQRKVAAQNDFDTIVKESYNNFLSTALKQYQEDNLENENEEFAHIVTEYRDGLLLFDLMETEIWNAAKNDSVGLNNFYEAHKDKYFWNDRVDAIVASSAKKKAIKTVSEMLEKGKTPNEIKDMLNSGKEVNVLFSTGKMDATHQALPTDFEFKKGISKIYNHNGAFVVALVNEVLPKTMKSFEESKGKVISDFQNYKEINWLKTLAEKYEVKINNDILAKVKTQIHK
jgi:peptidyl-prolyl cis-trans isomerase SurA